MTASKHVRSDRHPAEARASTPDYGLSVAFLEHLRRECPSGIHLHYNSATRHFLLGLHQCRIPLANVDDTVVDHFQRHRCRCSRYSARELRTSDYGSRVRRFVRFMEDHGDIPVVDDIEVVATHIGGFGDYLDAAGHSRFVRSGIWCRPNILPAGFVCLVSDGGK